MITPKGKVKGGQNSNKAIASLDRTKYYIVTLNLIVITKFAWQAIG